jgi:hypothetical protein
MPSEIEDPSETPTAWAKPQVRRLAVSEADLSPGGSPDRGFEQFF